jgi:hypothetical protein
MQFPQIHMIVKRSIRSFKSPNDHLLVNRISQGIYIKKISQNYFIESSFLFDTCHCRFFTSFL